MNIGRATIVDSHLLEASRYCSVFRMSTGISDCFVGLVILDDAADVMGLVSGARVVFLDGTFLVSTALRLALPVVVDGVVFAGILCISVFPSRLRLIPLAIVSRLRTLSSPGRVITPWEGGKKILLRSQFEDSNVGFPVEVINADQMRLKKPFPKAKKAVLTNLSIVPLGLDVFANGPILCESSMCFYILILIFSCLISSETWIF